MPVSPLHHRRNAETVAQAIHSAGVLPDARPKINKIIAQNVAVGGSQAPLFDLQSLWQLSEKVAQYFFCTIFSCTVIAMQTPDKF